MKSIYQSQFARYFILDSLWLMQTKYCDFIRSYWEEFFNVPSNLKLTIKDIEDEIQKMIKEDFIFIKEGWCFLTQD